MPKLTTFVAMIALAASAVMAGAQASELRMTVEKPHFTCEGHGSLMSHAAYVPGAYKRRLTDDAPLPCCDGQIGCAQFLSTSTIIHTDRSLRG